MPTRPLHGLLDEVFRFHGYATTLQATLEGRRGAIYTVPLLAEKEGFAAIVEVRGAGDVVDADAVADLCHVARDAGADLAVLAHVEEATPDAHAGNDGLAVLWGPTTLVRLVGEVRLAAAAGLRPRPLPLEMAAAVLAEAIAPATTLEELLPEAFRDATPATVPLVRDLAKIIPAAESGEDVPAPSAAPVAPAWPLSQVPSPVPPAAPPAAPADDFGTGPRVRPSTLPNEAARAPPAPQPQRALAGRHPLLAPRLDLAEATKRARDLVYGVVRAELLLRPVHLFDFEVDLLVEGSLRYETVGGRLAVDATRPRVGAAERTWVPAEAAPTGDYTVEERQLRIEADKAVRLAEDWVASQHTRLVEMRLTDREESFAYSEKRKVRPRAEHIRLQHVGTFHRPAWRLHGANGHVDVDALDGRPVDENLRNPHPDIIMVD